MTLRLHWVRTTLAGVGSMLPGDRRIRATDLARRSVETTDGEKLNYKRPDPPQGEKGLAGELIRRRCRNAKNHCRWVQRSFWFLPLEIMDIDSCKRCTHGSALHTTIGPRSNHL